MKRKRGNEPEYVRDKTGREVHGLSAQPIRNQQHEIVGYRHYATWSKPRKWLGTIPTRGDAEAIFRFHQWDARNGRVTLTDPRVLVRTMDTREWPHRADGLIPNPWPQVEPFRKQKPQPRKWQIPEDVYWARVKDDRINRPTVVARMTGLEVIAHLANLPMPSKPLPLEACGRLYIESKQDCNAEGMKNVQTWWDEFCDILNQ